jgi:hypothetical protein
MRTVRSISALIGCAALLASCGGGGSTPAVHSAAATSTATSAPTGTPYATAHLTIKFPATFHTAKKASAKTSVGATAATSARRAPAYVNPNTNDHIDIYVNGVDETTGLAISNVNSDGTQDISLPIYSSTSQQIVAVETINGTSNYPVQVLAIGEADLPIGSFQPGDQTNVGLTMLMNAVGAGITSDYSSGSDATIDTSAQTPYSDNVYACGAPANGSDLYLFAYDVQSGFETGQGTFVAAGGLGIAVPNLGGYTNQSGTYPLDSVVTSGYTGIAPGFVINYQSPNGGLVLNAVTSNPAAAVQQDAYYNQGVYPGIDLLYQGGTLSNVINAITNATITTPIYVDPDFDGC